MNLLLILFTLINSMSRTIGLEVVPKFNITIETPESDVIPMQVPYKSIHVRYPLPNTDDQWNIVAIEPLIPRSENAIQQIRVHLCGTTANRDRDNAIWYDDQTYCNSDQSMLIYQWMPHTPKSTFQMSEDLGFGWNKSQFLLLSVKYSQEQQLHDHVAGVILHITTVIPRFHIGTIFIGNNQRRTRFSCRSSNYPRLITAVKPLFPKTSDDSWRVYVIRSRNFGRKLVQFVGDSTMFSSENRTDLELISGDIFLIPGDYIIAECTSVFDSMCQFLVYFTYKNLPYKYVDENAYTCQADNHPDLFKLLPSYTDAEKELTSSNSSSIEGTTVFLIVCTLLFVIWISIIIGCVIMRRVRGLVNFRSEPTTPYSSHGTKPFFPAGPVNMHAQQKIAAEGDRIAQMDVEHMGLMS